jgi:hypothetical protein
VFVTLGMSATGYRLLERGGRPVLSQCREGKVVDDPLSSGVWRNGVSWRLLGAGGMMTNLDDLGRWADGVAGDKLFRPDIARRYRSFFYGPSYRCGTEGTALGGSNGMTRSLILHYPDRRQAVIGVATHREHNLPDEGEVVRAICRGD